MIFVNETAAINGIADTILKGGVSLYNAVKYIYSITEKDFYNVNIKDAFKVVLNNVTDTDSLQALGLRINDRTCVEMQNEEYNRVLPMIVYSLAVRIPTLKNVRNGEDCMSDDQLYRLYTAVMEKGAENYNDLISETFLETKYLVRKGKKIPPYTADWYKTYIYNYVPSLAEITNKNMFLFGLVDVLFAMFYACLEEELHNKIIEFTMDAAEGGEE